MHYFTSICNHDRYNYEKLLEWVERILRSESNRLPLLKNAPPSLLQTDYKSVKFWLEKAYKEYQKRDDSNTNGLVIRKRDAADHQIALKMMTRNTHTWRMEKEFLLIDTNSQNSVTRLEKSSILYNMLSLRHPPGVNWDLMLMNISGLR